MPRISFWFVIAALTWLLVGVAFDSGSSGQHGVSEPSVVTPAAATTSAYPPDYRGMP